MKNANAVAMSIDDVKFESGTSLANLYSGSNASVPAAMPGSSVFKGPFAKYEQNSIAAEFSIIVVMTSLTLSFAFRTAGIKA